MPSWRLKGKSIKNCNCDYGCPCDFLGPPSKGGCTGFSAMKIDQGNFGEVGLDGLHWAGLIDFPGPLHEGNGVLQPVIDANADAQQRDALLTILSGKDQSPGSLFVIFNSILAKVHDPLFLPFSFEFDYAKRRAKLSILGLLESTLEPIRNPVTGGEHRILVQMPEGFEYREAEITSGQSRATGKVTLDLRNSHGSLANVAYTENGFAGYRRA